MYHVKHHGMKWFNAQKQQFPRARSGLQAMAFLVSHRKQTTNDSIYWERCFKRYLETEIL